MERSSECEASGGIKREEKREKRRKRDGGSWDKDGGSWDKDGGSWDKDGDSWDKDGDSWDKDVDSWEKDSDSWEKKVLHPGLAKKVIGAKKECNGLVCNLIFMFLLLVFLTFSSTVIQVRVPNFSSCGF